MGQHQFGISYTILELFVIMFLSNHLSEIKLLKGNRRISKM